MFWHKIKYFSQKYQVFVLHGSKKVPRINNSLLLIYNIVDVVTNADNIFISKKDLTYDKLQYKCKMLVNML